MRHRVKGRKLGRTQSHRAALMRSLATSLFKHKRIRTTLAKAKEARSFAESLITKARKNDLHARKQVISKLYDKHAVKELFSDIISRVGDRPGGYTRVIKLGNRKGDAADMAILELVDFNDIIRKKAEEEKEKKEEKKSSRKKAAKEEPVVEAKVVEETPAKEKPKKKTKAVKETKAEEKPEKKTKAVKETKTEEKPKKKTRKKKEE